MEAAAKELFDSDGKNGELAKKLHDLIRLVPDFPQPGILFRDITTLLVSPEGLSDTLEGFYQKYKDQHIDLVAGMEARGFLFGPALAIKLGCGFVMLRKPNKLPGEKHEVYYGKEYGKQDCLCLSKGLVKSGQRVLILDDLIATGGTAAAAIDLIKEAGGEVAGSAFIVELSELPGRENLEKLGSDVFSLIKC
ncbi:Adenine phosphoribosyltransferase [Balamuthia mandrillaris]